MSGNTTDIERVEADNGNSSRFEEMKICSVINLLHRVSEGFNRNGIWITCFNRVLMIE